MGFLENTISSLRVGDLPVCGVFDLLDLNLSTTHIVSLFVKAVALARQKEMLRERDNKERDEDEKGRNVMKWGF